MARSLRFDAHVDVTEAAVREGRLRRHDVRPVGEEPLWILASGIGPPRLWGYAVDAVFRGFEAGLRATPDDRPAQLRAGVTGARRALATAAEALLEREPPDAAIVATALIGTSVHVVSVGATRVYLHRRGQTQRLTPRDESEEGLLQLPATEVREDVAPGDLLMVGTTSAFSTRAVGRVAAALQGDRKTPVATVASLLTSPAERAGVGAAVVVVRLH